MKKSDGWQRPDPERTRSKRKWEPGRRPAGTRGAAPIPEATEGAAKGASLGYKVSDEQFDEGKAHAQLRDIPGAGTDLLGMSAFGGLAPDTFISLSERLMRDAMLWFEYFAKTAGSSSAFQSPIASRQTSTAPARGIVVDLSSPLPVELTFTPNDGAELRPLAVHELRATDPDFPGITGAQVACLDGAWHISARVAAKQPAGLYTGIVFDREDGAIRGTLALNVKKR
jgi:hypothetical protein